MLDITFSMIDIAGVTLFRIIPVSLGLAIIFSILPRSSWCNPGPRWWRKRQLPTDICYWFVTPVSAHYARIFLLIACASIVFNVRGGAALISFYRNGHGPLAELPLWLQIVLFVIASDFLLYWIHRIFHSAALWKYHAVHHSSADLDWISAARFHPVNLLLGSVAADVCLLVAGFSPDVILFMVPFTVAYSAFVHANLDWTLGPLRYVLVSPVFHRWHHDARYHGTNINFAALLPIWDILFGTFSLPAHRLPDMYGVNDANFPQTFSKQMQYPFVV